MDSLDSNFGYDECKVFTYQEVRWILPQLDDYMVAKCMLRSNVACIYRMLNGQLDLLPKNHTMNDVGIRKFLVKSINALKNLDGLKLFDSIKHIYSIMCPNAKDLQQEIKAGKYQFDRVDLGLSPIQVSNIVTVLEKIQCIEKHLNKQ